MQLPLIEFSEVALECVPVLAQVTAVCTFVEKTGKPAGIGTLQDAVDIVLGEKGTLIIPAAAKT